MYDGFKSARWAFQNSHRKNRGLARQRGVTLVEVVLFMVIVSVALSAILGLLAISVARSADPLIVRQSLAIAESLMQEIVAQPFTEDDPDGGPDTLGPEAGEERGSGTLPFDNVNDYHGYTMNGVIGADGSAVPELAAYQAQVEISTQALTSLPANYGLLIRITVTGPGGTSVGLTSFRARTQ